jgi:hypothetical protein
VDIRILIGCAPGTIHLKPTPMKKKLICIVSALWLLSIAAVAQDFNEVFKAVASDRAAGDLFGNAVSICGNYAIVGAVFENEDAEGGNSHNYAGSAYIFERDGSGNWTQVQKIVAPDRAANDFFGSSVSISGNYAIVGASCESEDAAGENTLDYAGSAYIFERDGSGNWTQVQKIVALDRAEGDFFGNSVSISGNYVLVGDTEEDEDAEGENTLNSAGSAYIFERDGSGNWTQVQKIVASDRAEEDYFGGSVSISGNFAIVGADYEDENAEGGNTFNRSGSAYIFERDGSGNWTEVQKIVASDRAMDDFFSNSVSISGNYAVVSADCEDEDAEGGTILNDPGSAYIFERDGSGNWNETQKIVASDRASFDHFGNSVSISGNYALVGAHYEDEDPEGGNTIDYAGSAYIFERNGSGSWAQVQKIVAPDRGDEDEFGSSVSISGNYVIAGAEYEDEDAEGGNTLYEAGSAYIFESCTPGGASDADNIIENGDFEDCILSPWSLYVFSDAGVTANAVLFDGACTISGISLPADPQMWYVSLNQNFSNSQLNRLETGSVYILSFKASAETNNRPCRVAFQKNGDPWTALLDKNIVINTAPKTYTYEFTATTIYPSMWLTFQPGEETGWVTFDNVSIKKKAEENPDALNSNNRTGVKIFPNPASGFLNIYAEEGSTVKLYNGMGLLVMEGTIVNERLYFETAGLPKGIYMVKVNTGNSVSVTKVVIQ